MTDKIERLAKCLASKDRRVAVVPADPPDVPAGGVNVWTEPADRYPYTTVYEPIAGSDYWLWGPNFEHRADPDVEIPFLSELVLATLPARGEDG